MKEIIDKYFIAKNIKKISVFGNDEKNEIIKIIEKENNFSIVEIEDAEIVVVVDDSNYLQIEKEIAEKKNIEIISLKEMLDKIQVNQKNIVSKG